MVVTGDIHLAAVADLRHEGEVVATELVGTSISSGIEVPDQFEALVDQVSTIFPDVKYVNLANRGWCRCTVEPDGWTAEYRAVEDATVPDSPVRTDRTFRIAPDRPGAVPA